MSYTEILTSIVTPFFQQLLSAIGNLILALIVFVIGYFISIAIGRLIAEILKSVKFNKLFDKEGWRRALQRANVQVNPAEFLGAIFKWIFVIASLVIAVDILKLTSFAGFLTQVLNYLPNVVVAVLVFVVAVIISDIVEKLVRVTVERLKVGSGYLASTIVKWAIWIFTFFLILDQLLPESMLIKTLYTAIVYGVVGALALGMGLAIGLGGKDTAAKIIGDMHKKASDE
jgi:hypothetical protein